MQPKPLLQNIWSFLIKPTPRSNFHIKPRHKNEELILKIKRFLRIQAVKSIHILRIYVIIIPIAITLSVILSFISSNLLPQEPQNRIIDLMTKDQVIATLFYSSIIAPIVEELAFRVHLKISPARLAFFIVIQLIFIFISIASYIPILTNLLSIITGNIGFILATIISLILLLIILTFLFRYLLRKLRSVNRTLLSKLYFLIFYLSAIYFGLIHIWNYEGFLSYWYIVIIMITPQVVAGIFMGYVRVQYGLLWSIIFHSIYNATLILPVAVMLLFTSSYETMLQSSAPIIDGSLPQSDLLVYSAIGLYFIFLFLGTLLGSIYNLLELLHHRKK